ncbi:MAG: GNAT family N-acetyltransferase [Promethearchaeota archaeon]
MFTGKTIRLRSLELDDIPNIAQVYNSLEARRFLDNVNPLSSDDLKQWIRSTWDGRKSHSKYFFAIDLTKTNKLIGMCGLFNVAKINRKAELFIVIFENKHRGKGQGTEALQLLLRYAFNQLNLHRIVLFTHDLNTPAQQVYKKIGFKPGGRRRQASFFEGAYHDLLLYDMLASEFEG